MAQDHGIYVSVSQQLWNAMRRIQGHDAESGNYESFISGEKKVGLTTDGEDTIHGAPPSYAVQAASNSHPSSVTAVT